MILNAFLYALAIFVALGIISICVAVLMRIVYAVLHKSEKKAKVESTENPVESKGVSQ